MTVVFVRQYFAIKNTVLMSPIQCFCVIDMLLAFAVLNCKNDAFRATVKPPTAAKSMILAHCWAAYHAIDDDVVIRHTLPVFTRLGRCPIVSWDFAGAVGIFGPNALPVIHQ